MMPLMTPISIPLVSFYTDNNAHHITWPKMPYCTVFQMSWPKEFSYAIYNTTGITCCWWHWQSHDQTSHMWPHSDCLDLRNSVVPLTMLSVWCDARKGAWDCWDMVLSMDTTYFMDGSYLQWRSIEEYRKKQASFVCDQDAATEIFGLYYLKR